MKTSVSDTFHVAGNFYRVPPVLARAAYDIAMSIHFGIQEQNMDDGAVELVRLRYVDSSPDYGMLEITRVYHVFVGTLLLNLQQERSRRYRIHHSGLGVGEAVRLTLDDIKRDVLLLRECEQRLI